MIKQDKQSENAIIHLIAVCLVAMIVTTSFSNFGAFIPLLRTALQVSDSQIGLFSTFFFIGFGLMCFLGGTLADRCGSHITLLFSLVLFTCGTLLLPLISNLPWMIACRAIMGLGAGAALTSGSRVISGLNRHAALGQGLGGGATQCGVALGLLVTPHLLAYTDWRSTLWIYGLLGVIACMIWWLVPEDRSPAVKSDHPQGNFSAGIRSPSIWILGLANMGSCGLGNAIAAWLVMYFVSRYGLSLSTAAQLGSLTIFGGILLRPLGGILLNRWHQEHLLIRIGSIAACLGMIMLATPVSVLPLAYLGSGVLSLGINLPYAAFLNRAAKVGSVSGIGMGAAQGLIGLMAQPTAIIGPPFIGLLLERTGSFTVAFGSIGLFFGGMAIISSCFIGSALVCASRRSERQPRGQDLRQGRAISVFAGRTNYAHSISASKARLAYKQKRMATDQHRPFYVRTHPSEYLRRTEPLSYHSDDRVQFAPAAQALRRLGTLTSDKSREEGMSSEPRQLFPHPAGEDYFQSGWL
jgi:cyanate permease